MNNSEAMKDEVHKPFSLFQADATKGNSLLSTPLYFLLHYPNRALREEHWKTYSTEVSRDPFLNNEVG